MGSDTFGKWIRDLKPVSIVIGALCVIALLIIVFGHLPTPRLTQHSGPTESEACAVTHEYMKDLLAVPASASYQSCAGAAVVDESGGLYSVSSYVYSQNSLGAFVRTDYVMEVQYDAHVWTMKDVSTTP